MAEEKFSLWHGPPSIPAAATFAVLFAITSFYHTWQAYRLRSKFMIAFIIGGYFEVGGYIGRIAAHSNLTSMGIYIWQTLLLLLSPTLFAASIYMTLGRIILHTRGEHLAPIARTKLTKIFVIGDIFSFIVQSGGGAMMSKASSQNTGKVIVLIGLAIQVIMFGIFIGTSAVFHKRLSTSPTTESSNAPWKKYMYGLYVTSALIFIRSVFRILEFQGGHNGVLMTTEFFIYIFDAAPMLGVMLVFNLVHPGELISSYKNVDGTPLSHV
ncbi:RTM1-like protein, putative [Glarea lozoyensis ATCC 20868]|uniref:RTM1-like protein, putative n=2 Tax=Glarea lozoyensis TaxID=101852 RepID=S3D4Z6_GLAL2|nr:RTM1-like protein, putative [Glarea lozoyensis ATCC 20868]EHK97250.1 putative protein RTA1 [Glarea lozoyensis 74030]EPE32169.1 RTM1-like protein, putative [Glarea lozoyensis ATCC 20868]